VISRDLGLLLRLRGGFIFSLRALILLDFFLFDSRLGSRNSWFSRSLSLLILSLFLLRLFNLGFLVLLGLLSIRSRGNFLLTSLVSISNILALYFTLIGSRSFTNSLSSSFFIGSGLLGFSLSGESLLFQFSMMSSLEGGILLSGKGRHFFSMELFSSSLELSLKR
jgi:hypothetical protein